MNVPDAEQRRGENSQEASQRKRGLLGTRWSGRSCGICASQHPSAAKSDINELTVERNPRQTICHRDDE